MKQVLQSRSGLTVVRDVPAPPCPPGGVLVQNLYSAISSGTERTGVESNQRSLLSRARERPDLVKQTIDTALREGLRSSREQVRRKLEEETRPGYSSAGRVIEVGPRVAGIAPGDLVACAGVGHASHAEVVAVPRNLCARIPDGVPMTAAALTTIAAIAMHGIRLSDVRLGERVAVIGCGLIGQIAVRLLRAAGAMTIAIDLDPERVSQAVAGGADCGLAVDDETSAHVDALFGGEGVDHALVTAGAPTNDPLLLGAEILRDRGALTLVGAVPVELPREPLYRKELRFRISRSYGPGRYDADFEERGLDYPLGYVRWTERRNMESVLDLQARGLLVLEHLVDEALPVERADEAYARLTGPPEQRPRGALVLAYPDEGDDHVLAAHAAAPGGAAHATKDDAPTVGFIGAGNFARAVLVPAFKAAGARLELVGGGGGPSAEAAVRQLGFARIASSEQAVLEDPGVDAVVVGTRHATHAALSAAGLRAGKHVFCEKPLALTEEELADVVEGASGAPGILAVGFNRRFSPLAVALREHVVRGGEPIAATYRVSAGDVPRGHWVHDLEQGGGRMIGEVCHFIDTLSFLTGHPVVEVHAMGHSRHDLPVQASDDVVVSLTFADGSVGSVAYVARSAPGVNKERLEVFGGGGVGILDDYRTLELHGPSGGETRKAKGGQEKGHREEVAAFVEGVRTGVPPVPLPEVENVSLSALAAVESLRTGRPVRIEAAQETLSRVGPPR